MVTAPSTTSNPVARLVAVLGRDLADHLVTDTLCSASIDAAIEPQAWRSGQITDEQATVLDALADRAEIIASLDLSITLGAGEVASLTIGPENLVLGDDREDRAALAMWLTDGAVLVDPTTPLLPGLSLPNPEHVIDRAGVVDYRDDETGDWVRFIHVATLLAADRIDIAWVLMPVKA